VFSGILSNSLFCGILLVTAVLQVLIIMFGREAFHVAEDGLDRRMWLISICIGAGSLPMQQIINVLYTAGLKYKGYRSTKRRRRDGGLSLMNADGKAKAHRE
jgi:hypothetical protein